MSTSNAFWNQGIAECATMKCCNRQSDDGDRVGDGWSERPTAKNGHEIGTCCPRQETETSMTMTSVAQGVTSNAYGIEAVMTSKLWSAWGTRVRVSVVVVTKQQTKNR